MPVIECKPLHQNQNGTFPNSSSAPYVPAPDGDGNIQVTANAGIAFRFYTQIPPGATVNSAYLKIGYGAKFGDQSASAECGLFYPLNSNDPPLTTSSTWTSFNPGFHSSFTLSYVANSGAQATNINVTSAVQTQISTYGLIPGGHMSFAVYSSSESGDLRLNTMPQLIIDYTPATSPSEHWDFNMLLNPDFNSSTYAWDVNQGFFNSITTGGTITRDTGFTRNGIATGKFTCPTPESNKGTGLTSYAVFNEPSAPYIFTGWIYIPAALPNVYCQFFYNGNKLIDGPRDAWQPFCSDVITNGTGYALSYPSIVIDPGYTAGQNFWMTELAVFKSSFRQEPWTGRSPTRSTITHGLRDDTTRGPHVRRSVPKSRVVNSTNGGTSAARRTYKKGDNGLWTEAGEAKI